jgi:hypothetical protein
VPETFAPGDLVRTRTRDAAGHTRLPRYARGVVGEVVEYAGQHPLPDESALGQPPRTRAVYHVRFSSSVLFGSGDHAVTVELWEDYLEPAAGHSGDKRH